MRPTHSPEHSALLPLGDRDTDTLDALVSDSRRLGRFWPPMAGAESKAVLVIRRVSVPARTQRLVAGMPEYGS